MWLALLMLLTIIVSPVSTRATDADAQVVISQVYGGGGNSGATLTNDFVELFNRSTTAVDMTGWSVQYASATGSTWQRTALSGTIQPGQHYLIQQAVGSGGTISLPTPDTSGNIAMSATAGKVALLRTNTTLASGTVCPISDADVVDFVGYGPGTNCAEGSPTSANLSNTTAALRAGNGCTDTNNNSADFSNNAPNPRNTASPLSPCSVPDVPIVSIQATDADASEGGPDSGTFRIIRNGDNAAVLTVSYTVGGTAGAADYTPTLAGQIDIPAGQNSVDIVITPIDDTDVENSETVVLTISAGAGYDLGSPISATITITDNDSAPPVACSAPDTPIGKVQGSGTSSPLAGQQVTVQGVVVGDFEGPSPALRGFYLQDTGDGDPATSDGMFVFNDTTDSVSLGQVVQVTGNVSEFQGQTQITPSNIEICGTTGTVDPVDVTMPFPPAVNGVDYLERFEGMLVRFPQELVISEYFNFDRFGEIVLTWPLANEDRPYTPTAIEEPGSPAYQERLAANRLSRITLDDGRSNQNPDPARHPNGNVFDLSNRFRGGDIVANATGILDYRFSLYRIQPTEGANYTSANARPPAPDNVGGSLKVASFNVLNYFTTLGSRGADTAEEFERQSAKIVAALQTINADIVGLIEIENNTTAIATLVNKLNTVIGTDTYAYIDTGVIGTDEIKVAFIYKPATVTLSGGYQVLDSSVDPRFIDTKNRPALAQTFVEEATGAKFTVVVNHFKSKGSDCNDVGDPETGDGQGNCNLTRTAAAEALVDWLATDPTGSEELDFLIIGDLNAYDKEDPIDAIKAGTDDIAGSADDYTDLIFTYQGEFAYSYVFDGQYGYLDHALANAAMTAQVTGVTEWHINADEPDILDYDTTFKQDAQDALYEPNAFRSSDHDPVIVGLDLDAPPTLAILGNAGKCVNDRRGAIRLELADDRGVDALTVDVTSDNPDIQAMLMGDGAERWLEIDVQTQPNTPIAGMVTVIAHDSGGNSTEITFNVLAGTQKDDTLLGEQDMPNVIFGLNGQDVIAGGDFSDLLCGGNGKDELSGGDSADTLDGGNGNDTLTGGPGADAFDGGNGKDTATDYNREDQRIMNVEDF